MEEGEALGDAEAIPQRVSRWSVGETSPGRRPCSRVLSMCDKHSLVRHFDWHSRLHKNMDELDHPHTGTTSLGLYIETRELSSEHVDYSDLHCANTRSPDHVVMKLSRELLLRGTEGKHNMHVSISAHLLWTACAVTRHAADSFHGSVVQSCQDLGLWPD